MELSFDQYLLLAGLNGCFLVIGALMSFGGTVYASYRSSKQISDSNHEEQIERRRQEFEKLLAELATNVRSWQYLQTAYIQRLFGRAGDMMPEPSYDEVDELWRGIEALISRLEITSPSEDLDSVVAEIDASHQRVTGAQRLANHISISGSEADKERGPDDFHPEAEQFVEKVDQLIEATKLEGRQHR